MQAPQLRQGNLNPRVKLRQKVDRQAHLLLCRPLLLPLRCDASRIIDGSSIVCRRASFVRLPWLNTPAYKEQGWGYNMPFRCK